MPHQAALRESCGPRAYDTEQDQLRITLVPGAGFESEEVAEGIVFDYDRNGNVVSVEFDHAAACTCQPLPGAI